MAWIQGMVVGDIAADGRIECRTESLTVREGRRPGAFEESGADAEQFHRIQQRIPGPFRTPAFMGGATALLVPFRALAVLPKPLMERLRAKYGSWGDDVVPMFIRNTAANAVWNAAEPAGGMAETTALVLERLKETVELGIFRDDGWLRFVLPDGLHRFQKEFDREQVFWWNILRPGFRPCTSAPITLLPIGRDQLDGCPGVITAGAVGDFELTTVGRIDLEGTEWRIADTEGRPGNSAAGEPEWIALRRIGMVVAPRQGKNPIGLHFSNRDGALHPGGNHIALSGEAWEYNLTHIARAVITELGWNGGV